MKKKNSPEHEKPIDTEALADRWGIATRTLEDWRKARKGPAFIKFGEAKRCRVLYRMADVVAFEKKKLIKTG